MLARVGGGELRAVRLPVHRDAPAAERLPHGLDVLGGDYLGWGSANEYRSKGRARVRNVKLPTGGFLTHGRTPDVDRLLSNPQALAWMESYVPASEPVAPKDIPGSTEGIEFGADVWKSVKRHWVIELQRLIRARRGHTHGD